MATYAEGQIYSITSSRFSDGRIGIALKNPPSGSATPSSIVLFPYIGREHPSDPPVLDPKFTVRFSMILAAYTTGQRIKFDSSSDIPSGEPLDDIEDVTIAT